MVEHLLPKQRVVGSNPISRSTPRDSRLFKSFITLLPDLAVLATHDSWYRYL